MSRGSLVLVPSGGLANRMRAMASAWQLCRRIDAGLQVVWFQGWGMRAAFGDLFEPLDFVREAGCRDFVLHDRPRRHNLWLPWLPQRARYGRGVIHERQVAALRDGGFDFGAWLCGQRRYMSCYDELEPVAGGCYAHLFKPCPEVMTLVGAYGRRLSGYVVGMHIRRTDNIESIRRSPIELFLRAGQRELSQHPDLTIFLATDSEEVKQQLHRVFGRRVVTSDHEASRDSVAGLREGVADLWTLSRTTRIYGSAGSSFSVMASSVGGCELCVLEQS